MLKGAQMPWYDTDNLDDIRAEFDEIWYSRNYKKSIHENKRSDESNFEFYVRYGARNAHDPNSEFSEILYRLNNPDVSESLIERTQAFGFLHYVRKGRSEAKRPEPGPHAIESYRKVVTRLDLTFILREYNVNVDQFVSVVDFYFQQTPDTPVSPSEIFSELGYLDTHRDVLDAVRQGTIVSGFDHYCQTSNREIRATISHLEYSERLRKQEAEEVSVAERESRKRHLEWNIPGICHPKALDSINSMSFFLDRINVRITGNEPGLLVLVPNFMPEILFGGYLAFFDFLTRLKAKTELPFRLLVVNGQDHSRHTSSLFRMGESHPEILGLFESIHKFDNRREVEISAGYRVVSYATELHYIAHSICEKINSLPIFFIQEYEPDFHSSCDIGTFIKNSYSLPHCAVFNSERLVQYMKKHTAIGGMGKSYRYAIIENAIRQIEKERTDFLTAHKEKSRSRLIFYARPERHADRNHFGTFIMALRSAVNQGVFDENWEFIGVGSLDFNGNIPLGFEHEMKIITKLPKDEYEDLLLTGDIGVSLISTPHPGIIHFQMASYGLTTLTNIHEFRSADWLQGVNKNLLGVPLGIDGLCEGLKTAVESCKDVERRYDNALENQSATKDECVAAAIKFLEEELSS